MEVISLNFANDTGLDSTSPQLFRDIPSDTKNTTIISSEKKKLVGMLPLRGAFVRNPFARFVSTVMGQLTA